MNIKKNSPHISIVTPVYGSPESLSELCERLVISLTKITESFEIILVNDASPDDSWELIKNLARNDKRVKGINLSRNFGQHYAIIAGLVESEGEWVVVMDCDLQDQPEEIIKMYRKVNKGFDIAFGWRSERKDGFFKKFFSKQFYRLLSYLTDTKQDAEIANFGIYHKRAINAVLSMKDEIKYFPVMIRWVGFNSCAVEIEHAERKLGESSYSFVSLIRLATDVMLSFSDKPLRLVVKLGLWISTLAFVISMSILVRSLFGDTAVPGWASTILSLWFLSGLIILVLGVVGIYVGKTFDQTKKRPFYVIKETT